MCLCTKTSGASGPSECSSSSTPDLALNKIPSEAYDEITKLFEIPQTIGLIGGRGKFGLYFVGNQKDNLILLDPHFNQETVENEDDIKDNRDTYR